MSPSNSAHRLRSFPETNWTVLLKNVQPGNSVAIRRARSQLCGSYWQPLYHYARTRGKNNEDAEDLVQGFFSRLLKENRFLSAQPEIGKFRTFLLTSFQRFIINEWEKGKRLKRGGDHSILSIDVPAAERDFELEPSNDTPEVVFDIQWARTVVANSLHQVEGDWDTPARRSLFDALKPFLTLEAEDSIAAIARHLNRNAGTVRMSLKQLRSEYRITISEIIRDTLPPGADPDEEIAYLVSLLLK